MRRVCQTTPIVTICLSATSLCSPVALLRSVAIRRRSSSVFIGVLLPIEDLQSIIIRFECRASM